MLPKGVYITDILKWDSTAFRHLYGAYYKRLVSYSFALSHDNDSAEDIVQDTFSALLVKRVPFPSVQALEFYLFSAVRNATISAARHNNVVADYVHDPRNRADNAEIMDDEIFGEDIYEQLFHAIDELPPRAREIFLMRCEGKSNREISENLGLSGDTVKTHVKRGLATLRAKLGDRDAVLLFLLLS